MGDNELFNGKLNNYCSAQTPSVRLPLWKLFLLPIFRRRISYDVTTRVSPKSKSLEGKKFAIFSSKRNRCFSPLESDQCSDFTEYFLPFNLTNNTSIKIEDANAVIYSTKIKSLPSESKSSLGDSGCFCASDSSEFSSPVNSAVCTCDSCCSFCHGLHFIEEFNDDTHWDNSSLNNSVHNFDGLIDSNNASCNFNCKNSSNSYLSEDLVKRSILEEWILCTNSIPVLNKRAVAMNCFTIDQNVEQYKRWLQGW